MPRHSGNFVAQSEPSLVEKVIALHNALKAGNIAHGFGGALALAPFAGIEIPFLAASDLGIFKSLFNRPKDWLDIEAMVAADSIDPFEVAETLEELLGEDPRADRMRALVQS